MSDTLCGQPTDHQDAGDFRGPMGMTEHSPLPCRCGAGDALRVPAALARSEASILSPLRYPGSKRRLAGYIEQAIRLNGLRPQLFVEPFAGGASVALQLLNDEVVEQIGLIDRDPLVAAFWQTVFFDADWLVEQVETVEVTLERWDAFKSAVPAGRRERALACLFLNRTSFSGILARRAGPLGGRQQTSENKLDCRFSRPTLVKRIRQAERLKKRVSFVWNLPWGSGLARLRRMQQSGRLPKETFFYFDPPFFEKAERLYTHFFDEPAHRKLRDQIVRLTDPWLLSYDSAERVLELYGGNGHGAAHVELLYSTSGAAGRGAAKEVILSNLPVLPSETRLWRRTDEWNRGQCSGTLALERDGCTCAVRGSVNGSPAGPGQVETMQDRLMPVPGG